MAAKPEGITLNNKLCTQLKWVGIIVCVLFPFKHSLATLKWRCAALWNLLTCTGEVLHLVLLLYRRMIHLFWGWCSLRLCLHMQNRKSCLLTQPLLAGFYMVTSLIHAWHFAFIKHLRVWLASHFRKGQRKQLNCQKHCHWYLSAHRDAHYYVPKPNSPQA